MTLEAAIWVLRKVAQMVGHVIQNVENRKFRASQAQNSGSSHQKNKDVSSLETRGGE